MSATRNKPAKKPTRTAPKKKPAAPEPGDALAFAAQIIADAITAAAERIAEAVGLIDLTPYVTVSVDD